MDGRNNSRTEVPEEIVVLDDMLGFPPQYAITPATLNRSVRYSFCISKDLLRVYSMHKTGSTTYWFSARVADIGYKVNTLVEGYGEPPRRIQINLATNEVVLKGVFHGLPL